MKCRLVEKLLYKIDIFLFRLLRFPKDGIIIYVELHDQGQELLIESESRSTMSVPILGLFQTSGYKGVEKVYKDSDDVIADEENIDKSKTKDQIVPGRIVVYGDSNCIDDSHLQKRMNLEQH